MTGAPNPVGDMGDPAVHRSSRSRSKRSMRRRLAHGGFVVAALCLGCGCATTHDGGDAAARRQDGAANGSGLEAEYYDSVVELSEASDLVVSADIDAVGISDYRPEGGDYQVAAIRLRPDEVFGRRPSSGPSHELTIGIDVLWSLGGPTDAEQDLDHLMAYLPERDGLWFLRWEPTVDAYRVVNLVAVWSPVADGYDPSLYRQSAQLARDGMAPAEPLPILDEIVAIDPDGVADVLRSTAGRGTD